MYFVYYSSYYVVVVVTVLSSIYKWCNQYVVKLFRVQTLQMWIERCCPLKMLTIGIQSLVYAAPQNIARQRVT